MTNQQPPESQNQPISSNLTTKIFNVVKQPQTQIIAGVSFIAIAIAGYTGTRYLVQEIIPTQVEKELEKLLKRDVEIGEITGFSLNSLRIENTNIPPTAEDPSFLEIPEIDVDFNLLSLILKSSLLIDIVVKNVTGYAQLDTLIKPSPEKKPLPTTLKLPPLPIIADINLQVENAQIAVTPNAKTKAIELASTAELNLLYDRENQPLDYQLSAQIDNDNNKQNAYPTGKINLEGQTLLSTTETRSQVNVTNLHPRRVVELIPQLPIDLAEGDINANLEVQIPSIPDWLKTSANGTVSVTEVLGKIDIDKLNNQQGKDKKLTVQQVKALQQPVTGEAYLHFQGQSVEIVSAEGKFGENLGGEIKGKLGINEGYNLQADLLPFQIGEVLPIVSTTLPFNVDGLAGGKILVTGDIDNPQVNGSLDVNNAIVDQVALGKIDTNFSADLDEFVLDKLEVKPQAGGQVMAMGKVKTNLRETITSGKKINVNQLPLQFNFTADLPSAEILTPYQLLPPEIRLGDLQAKGEIKGNLNNPNAQVNWQIPSANARGIGEISGSGELSLADNKFKIANTRLIANDGTITVNGNGDLKTKDFEGNLNTSQVTLTPFISQFCRSAVSCPNDKIDVNRPIIAENVDVNLKGKLDKIAIDKIDVTADANLNVDGGKVSVNSLLTNGNIEAKATATQIPIDSFLPSLPVTTTLVNSDINLRGDIGELLTEGISEGKIPNSLNLNVDSQLRVGDGMVNALANVDKENTNLIADVRDIPLQKIIPSLDRQSANFTIDSTQINANVKTQELLSTLNPNLGESTSNPKLGKSTSNPNLGECQRESTSNRNPRECQRQSQSPNLIIPPSLNIQADNNLTIAGGKVKATANITAENTQIFANANEVDINQIIPSVSAKVNDSQVNISLKTPELISLIQPQAENGNNLQIENLLTLNSLNVDGKVNAVTGKGKINGKVTVNNGLVNLNTVTEDINSQQIMTNFPLQLDNINSQLNASLTTSDLASSLTQIINADGDTHKQIESLVSLNSLNVNGKVNAVTGKGKVNAKVAVNNGLVNLNTVTENINSQQIMTNFPLQLDNINSQLNASLTTSDLASSLTQIINADGDTHKQIESLVSLNSLNVNGKVNAVTGKGKINGRVTVNNGLVNLNTVTENINSQQIMTNFPLQLDNINSQLNVSLTTSDLINTGINYLDNKTLSPIPSLNLTADTNLNLAEGKVSLQAKVNQNQWQTNLITQQINLANLATQLPFLESQLTSLIAEEKLPTDIEIKKDNAKEIKNNNANEIGNSQLINNGNEIGNSQQINNGEDKDKEINEDKNREKMNKNTLADLPPLDSQIKLSGNLTTLFQTNPSANINIQSANLQLGENNINAKGNVNLINLLTQPDIANLKLDVNANTDLAVIPTNTILDLIPPTKSVNLIPSELNLSGLANFQGKLIGKNLLTNPLGNNNLNVDGNLTLNNLILNDLEFEPTLTGKVKINPSEKMSIDLRGEKEIISAEIVPTQVVMPNSNIPLPFIPNNILFRKNDYPNDLLVEGKRNGKQFLATVNNFNLESLNLSPLTNFGLVGKLRGKVKTDVAINLTDFRGNGNLELTNVGVGKMIADKITADVNYQGDIIALNSGGINFGETSYDLQAKYNLANQDIFAKVDLEGDVKDIFDTLQISDISTVSALIQQLQGNDYFDKASDIASLSVGNKNDSIKTQVNLLYAIDQQIKTLARKIENGTIPDDLEITGKYEGEILIGGNLTNPTASIDFEGNQWQWLPQQDFPNIVQSLGLVMQETQSIPIPKLLLKADYANQELAIQPFQINIGKSEVYFAGDLSLNKQEGEFKIKDFSVDLVRNFVPTPIDIEGDINIEGTFTGNYQNPQIDGKIDVANASLEGAVIENKISGDFNYQDYQLNFKTTLPEEIQVSATLPYHPLVEVNAPANINVNLDTKAIALLGILSKGQIQLTGGEATANLSVETNSIQQLINNLDFKNFDIDSLLAQVDIKGEVELNEAKFNTIALSEPIYLTGKAKLIGNQQAISVENIQANIRDAEINIAGILPLIKPLKNNPKPLTVSIPSQKLQLENLYTGRLDGNIEVLGTALTPKIGGYVALSQGNVKIGSKPAVKSASKSELWYQWLGEVSKTNTGIFQPEVNNFEVKLDNLQLAQWGLYRFVFNGDLTVNGAVLDIQNLSADGEINLRRGQIYLGGTMPVGALGSSLGSGQTTFSLSRTNQNKITFNPNEPILNPNLDIMVEADITDYSRELPATQRNEIPEPIIRSGQGETVKVELAINGELQQLLPALAGNIDNICAINSQRPIADSAKLDETRLNQVSKCVNLAAINAKGSNLGILNTPLVELTSIPNRSESELINLIIGGQLLNFAEQLQDLSGEQLFETGLVQFVLVPLVNNVGFGVNETVSGWGKPLGMKDLRVFPLVEGVYEVQEKSNISVSYDYIYSEFKVRYQMRF